MKKRFPTPSPADRGAAPRPAGRGGTAPGRVRIIGGRWRRTPLAVLACPGLRPTPDRVRETLFNWLEHLLKDWSDVSALDMFAGSGALGFECASRGARRVTLVERQPRAAAALRELQQRLRCAGVQVVRDDALAVAARMAAGSLDLVFVDPPFDSGLLAPAIGAAVPLLRPHGLLYVESAEPLEAADLARWRLEAVREGRAGAVFFYLLRAGSC